MHRPGNASAKKSSLGELPPGDIGRWVASRKSQIVNAVRAGQLTLDEACERYMLSPEEFLNWERIVDQHGVRGLRCRQVQFRRHSQQPRIDAPMEQGQRQGQRLRSVRGR